MTFKVLSISVLSATFMLADVPVLPGGGGTGTPVNVCAYDMFVIGNQTAAYSDIQGSVAVGGNASYTGYSIGQYAPNNPSTFSLQVGGTVSFLNGAIQNGSVAANGGITLQNVSVDNGNVVSAGAINLINGSVNGQSLPYQAPPVSINFASAATYLQGAATYYGSLTPNGTTVNQWGGLVLTGYSSTLNIFSVPSSLLSSVWGVNIYVPSGSTVLINVSGTSATVPNIGYSYSGVGNSQVFWNFYQATALTIYQGEGTIFAPFAAATSQPGVVNGTVVVNSFSGNGQTNQSGFVGLLPVLPSGNALCH